MLAPRASVAFVCLRCELQLGRTRLPASTRRIAHAKFSASTRRRDGADELEALSRAHRPGSKMTKEVEITKDVKITKEVQPLNRTTRRRGKVLKETSARLGGIKQLGNDADILLLREIDVATLEEAPQKPEEVARFDVPNIHASLQQEDIAVTQEEINKQLESLRPKTHADPHEPHFVSQTTFVKLVNTLTTGFKQNQLAAFYSVSKNMQSVSKSRQRKKVESEVIDAIKEHKSIASRIRSEWQPGTTVITRRLPGTDINFRPKRAPISKQLLVDRILRDVWNLALLEDLEAPGELELSLDPWELRLLTIGEDNSLLHRLARERRAKLELFTKHFILRITADKTTAEYVAKDIEESLESVELTTLTLKHWGSQLLWKNESKSEKSSQFHTSQDLDVISSLTRTSILRGPNKVLLIRGFDKSNIAEAERTLIRFLPLKTSITHSIDTHILDTAKTSSYLLPILQEETSLHHAVRNKELGRHTLPVTRATDFEPIVEQPVDAGPVNRSVAAITLPVNETYTTKDEFSDWSSRPDYKLSAEFGQVLFPLDVTIPDNATDTKLSDTLQPPFVPAFPGLSTLLTPPDFKVLSSHKPPALIYEFTPAPQQKNFKAGQVFPSLHIQMRTSSNGEKAVLKKLSLGIQGHTHDVLLPDKSVDIRFFRYDRLRHNNLHGDKNVQEWADAVIENIASGGRLTAPSLHLNIPEWTIPGFPADAKGVHPLHYLFSGIQFRQTVTGRLLDTDVSYTTVQSGKLGAKTGMLSAHYKFNTSDAVGFRDEDGVKSFVKGCFTIADKITRASANTQAPHRKPRPKNENNTARPIKKTGLQRDTFESKSHAHAGGMNQVGNDNR